VTSGIDGIYPKGYAIGRIESVHRSAEGWAIDIAPAVDFSSLEAVLVVQGREPVEPAAPAVASTQGSE
jgi:rod shape-determining protein MreC